MNAESINELNDMMVSMNDIFILQDMYDTQIEEKELNDKSKQLGH